MASGLVLSAFASEAPAGLRETPPAERVALVIGNGVYDYALPNYLANPGNDAEDMGSALVRLGFEVTRLYNVGFDAMRQGLIRFSEKAARSEIAVVFYAGDTIEVNKCNYLLPVDIPEESLESHHMLGLKAIPLARVMESMQGASRFRLAILDASRRGTYRMYRTDLVLESKEFPPQLCRAEPQGKTLVAYSTQEGDVAADGKGRNSPYTQALLHYLKHPNLDVGLMFRLVRDAVMESTGGSQEPVVYGSSGQGVYLSVPPDPILMLDQAEEVTGQ